MQNSYDLENSWKPEHSKNGIYKSEETFVIIAQARRRPRNQRFLSSVLSEGITQPAPPKFRESTKSASRSKVWRSPSASTLFTFSNHPLDKKLWFCKVMNLILFGGLPQVWLSLITRLDAIHSQRHSSWKSGDATLQNPQRRANSSLDIHMQGFGPPSPHRILTGFMYQTDQVSTPELPLIL